MRFTAVLASLTLTALPTTCQGQPVDPPAPPPCPGEVILLSDYQADFQAEHGCDLQSPQILGYWAHDPGPVQLEECLGSGGGLIYTRHGEICIDIDY